jgi:hypothetical protein
VCDAGFELGDGGICAAFPGLCDGGLFGDGGFRFGDGGVRFGDAGRDFGDGGYCASHPGACGARDQ